MENFLPSVVFLSLTKSREDSVEKSFNLSLIELFGKKILSIFRSLFQWMDIEWISGVFFLFFSFRFNESALENFLPSYFSEFNQVERKFFC